MKKIMVIAIMALFFFTPGLASSEGTTVWSPVRKSIPFDPLPGVFRFWSSSYNGHFYTISETEKNNIIANMPEWQYEGVVFDVYDPAICPGAPPGVCLSVYRFWSNTYRHHFYTISETEKNNIIANMPEWQYEGVAYAANTVPAIDPLYRFWSNTYKSHFYTTSIVEKTNIQNNMPEWQYEGIAYYVLPAGTSPGP